MNEGLIKNFDELAITPNRKMALEIMQTGLNAINTEQVINSSILLVENILFIKGKPFNLTKYKNIKVVGFGKSSADAALALEKILGSRITSGAVVSLKKVDTKYIETFEGTHPKPSLLNTVAGKKIYDLLDGSTEDDLIIVLISGGGSALLCYGEDEYKQGEKLYDSFFKFGKNIEEMNTIRKHISVLKGGGIAALAYPATVIGLIFSDIPGDIFENVASGPTYKDTSTIEDAKRIIEENNLGDFNLIETPKEDKYFKKVENFILVSNKIAVEAMMKKALEFNLKANIISTDLYDGYQEVIKKIFAAKKENTIVLAAGEPSVVINNVSGKGGRNLHMGLEVVKEKMINNDSVFISFASDGMDNTDSAGAIIDKNTIEKIDKLGLNIRDYSERFDSYPVFEKSGDLIKTGPTGSNVSDLMLLLSKTDGE